MLKICTHTHVFFFSKEEIVCFTVKEGPYKIIVFSEPLMNEADSLILLVRLLCLLSAN